MNVQITEDEMRERMKVAPEEFLEEMARNVARVERECLEYLISRMEDQ